MHFVKDWETFAGIMSNFQLEFYKKQAWNQVRVTLPSIIPQWRKGLWVSITGIAFKGAEKMGFE